MKHIKKRFLFEVEQKIEDDDSSIIFIDELNKKNTSNLIGKKVILQLGDKSIYGSFFKIKNEFVTIPIPDFTLIYFDQAQLRLALIEEKKKELVKKIGAKKSLDESNIGEIYSFFGLVSGFIIYLFTSMESFINHQIPPESNYFEIKKRQTLYYNFKQIQFLSFDKKIKEVMPFFTGKNFFQRQTQATQDIEDLKEFRDSIIHTKSSDNIELYYELIKKTLSFKYNQKLKAVSSYMNFYKPNYIKECNCGKDF